MDGGGGTLIYTVMKKERNYLRNDDLYYFSKNFLITKNPFSSFILLQISNLLLGNINFCIKYL